MIFLGFKTGDEEEQFGFRQGLLQLVYVHGSEEDDDFKIRTGGPVSRLTPFMLSSTPTNHVIIRASHISALVCRTWSGQEIVWRV